MELTLFVQAATTGKKKGPNAKKRKRNDDTIENISTILEEKKVGDKEYIVLPDSSLIPKKWKDIYAWFSLSKAPQSWIDIFNRNSSLSAEKIASSEYSVL